METEEIARLKQELAEAQAAARIAQEELQGFVYAASHDVKSALRSVSSYTQLLVRQIPPDPELAEFGFFINQGIKNAVEILDRMNAFSRIDLQSKKSPQSLALPLQMALMKLELDIKAAHAEVTYSDLPEAPVNETQFTALFENLIDNALKYRGSNDARIEIGSEEQDDGFLISVRDNGPGIKPEYHELVFTPFKRLHGKEVPGIGLGLAAARKIVQAHHGSLTVQSDGVNGSTFQIFLPF